LARLKNAHDGIFKRTARPLGLPIPTRKAGPLENDLRAGLFFEFHGPISGVIARFKAL
jgi:hypothetical protein